MILTSGVFDPLHAGHLSFLEHVKRTYNDELCVVLSDDHSKHLPLVPLHRRRIALLLLPWVSQVFTDVSVADAIYKYRPGLFIKGNDWEARPFPSDIQEALMATGVDSKYLQSPVLGSSSEYLGDYQRRLNAEKLAALEQWVSTQPTPPQWTPVTDYSRETRLAIERPNADAIADAFKGCRVIDFGCGFGYLVDLLQERGMDAFGWDPQFRPAVRDDIADLVVCREVLEHVRARGVRQIVNTLVSLSKRYIYLTTRFTAKPHLYDFDAADDLDPTHVSMLSQDLLRGLFVLEGCTRCPELEAKLDHKQLGRVLVYQVPQ